MADDRRTRVVVLGGGFAGAICAQQLEKRLHGRDVELVLLDQNNYFVFTPLLIEAGTGSLEPRHAVVSIRSFLKRTLFRQAEVLDIDTQRRRVRYRVIGQEGDAELAWDHLVLALGSVTHKPDVPGLAQHAFDIKGLADAVALRDRAIQLLERAEAAEDTATRRALLRFVIVGANFSGVELAGEFLAFLQEASRRYPRVDADDCSVTLVELSDRILSALDAELGDYARRTLERRGVDLRLENTVSAIHEDHVDLKEGGSVPTHTVVWCAGIAPPPVLREVGLPVDDKGYVVCDATLRVRGLEGVWGVGDCAVNVDPAGEVYPPTAQHAVREGKQVGRNIERTLQGRSPQPLRYRAAGSLAALGCRTGVARVFGVKLSGFPAWFVWRTVYLMKMPGWSRRLRVAWDWTADLFFRRDYVSLGIHRVGTQRRAAETQHATPTSTGSP
jgi:NADH dehydrogenase